MESAWVYYPSVVLLVLICTGAWLLRVATAPRIWTAFVAVGALAVVSMALAGERDYPIRPVPAHRVEFTDAFWQPRLETNRTVTIPYSLRMCEETGRIENFRVAAGKSDNPWTGRFGFNDSDISKVLEGAAYSLMAQPDAQLEAQVDELVELMADAQEDDGYIFTAWTARDRIDNPANIICCYPKENRWLDSASSHELYNLGHMYESAVAHREATGNVAFLDVATKSGELLLATFGPGKLEIPPGHPEVELGLVKLYRATGDRRYLDLAKFFLELRGVPTKDRPKLWGEYNQDHKPIVEQDEAVGHAVRAAYLYAAMADVAALTGDRSLVDTVDRLWKDVVGKKQYITGAIGATGKGEAFGDNYELPNESAYGETCAGIAVCYWNHRMFLLHGDGRYIDVLERTLYNNVLDGVSIGGDEFFYPNPLASSGEHGRSKWFDCSCCPTNICRFIPSVPGYVYATRDNGLWVNLFVAGSAEVELASGKVGVTQSTRYPWDGRVDMEVEPAADGQQFALHVRIPGWARGQVFPSDLYHYLDESNDEPTLTVNGAPVPLEVVNGYATIDRAWKPGDRVTLELPMPVRRVVAHENVEADRGRAALVRGPIVYCVEWPDVPDGDVANLVLADDAKLATEFRADLLGGIQVITGTAENNRTAKPAPFIAIPYYAWSHRSKGEMAVWLPRSADALEQHKTDTQDEVEQ
jgi:hypothetical protein